MTHVAFLRAVNVGGRIIKMAELVEVFQAAGLKNVKSFLASGNVLFDAGTAQALDIEATIESSYRTAFGHETQVFVRNATEIAAIVAQQPFPIGNVEVALTNCVGFTRAALPESARDTLKAIASEADEFAVIGREIYWLSTNPQSEASFTLKQLEKALGVTATFRGRNTVNRLDALCAKN
jgi:uncharacterized protein (DUF1697 family)